MGWFRDATEMITKPFTAPFDMIGDMFSGDVKNPNVPSPASSAETMSEWERNLRSIYNAQMQYAPLELQQQLDMQNKYGYDISKSLYDISSRLYPETVGLQESLAKQAREGMSNGMPDWYRRQADDYFKSMLGENVGSGIGADYYTTGMMEQQKNWQDYYRNLGLSMTGRQPLQQPTQGSYSNYMGNYSPIAALGNASSNYGNYLGAYSSMYGANAARGNPMMNLLGGLGGAALGGMI